MRAMLSLYAECHDTGEVPGEAAFSICSRRRSGWSDHGARGRVQKVKIVHEDVKTKEGGASQVNPFVQYTRRAYKYRGCFRSEGPFM